MRRKRANPKSFSRAKPKKSVGRRLTDTLRGIRSIKRRSESPSRTPDSKSRKKKVRVTDTIKGMLVKVKRGEGERHAGSKRARMSKNAKTGDGSLLKRVVVILFVFLVVATLSIVGYLGHKRNAEQKRRIEERKEAQRQRELVAAEKKSLKKEMERKKRKAAELALRRKEESRRRLDEEWRETVEKAGNILATTDDYLKARSVFEGFMKKCEESSYHRKAEAKITLLDNLIWYVTRPVIQSLKQAADSYMRQGDRSAAIRLFKSYSGTLAEETERERLTLARKYSRLNLDDSERRISRARRDAVKFLLLKGGTEKAMRALRPFEENERVGAILRLVREVDGFDKRLSNRFKENVGKVVKLTVGGKTREMKILDVAGDRVRGELNFGGVRSERTFAISELSLRERFRLLDDLSQEGKNLYVLLEKMEDIDDAGFDKLARGAGPLSSPLSQQRSLMKIERLAGRLERNGAKSQAGALRGVMRELGKTDLSEREIIGVRKAASAGLNKKATYELMSFSQVVVDALKDVVESSKENASFNQSGETIRLDQEWVDGMVRRIGRIEKDGDAPSLLLYDFTVEWLEAKKGGKTIKDYRPSDFQFDESKLAKYLDGFPGDLKRRKRKAFSRIKNLKTRLCGLMCTAPYMGKVELKDGKFLRGKVTRVTPKSFLFDTADGQKELLWSAVTCEQIVDMYEFYLLPKERDIFRSKTESRERERILLSEQYFDLFLFCDWYGECGRGMDFAVKAILLDPSKIQETHELTCDIHR